MNLISINNIKKYYGDRLILDIDKLQVSHDDKIGIVGVNGAGKTTLLKIILGYEEADEGNIYIENDYAYIKQSGIDEENNKFIRKTKFDAPKEYKEYLSGGEKVRYKISSAISKERKLIIADEPSANLDKEGVDEFISIMKNYKGAFLLVSHDRRVLDELCNTIIELDRGKIKKYKGNYSNYCILKEKEKAREELEYEKYISEKEKLESAIIVKEKLRDSIRKTPKRMGNSEARLHRKMGNQRSKKNIDGNIKALKSRIDHLEVKEKPKNETEIKINVVDTLEIKSKYIITAKDLRLIVGDKELINKGDFNIKNGEKVALIGENGCGKSSLLRQIVNRSNKDINISNKAVFGYYDQELNILDENGTILSNIKDTSSMNETFIRINLARFGFYREDVLKNINVLSGGERVKVALCKVLLSNNNLIILDEPTNFLDVVAIEALERSLINTNKTVIIVSHDDRLINNVCNSFIKISNKNIYQSYKGDTKHKQKDTDIVLKNRLSEIISLLSIEKDNEKKEKLEIEYNNLLKQI